MPVLNNPSAALRYLDVSKSSVGKHAEKNLNGYQYIGPMRTDISESKIGVIVGGGALSLAYIAACTALQSKILNKVGECGDIDNEILAHIPKNGDDPSDYYLELLRKSKSCHERLAEFYKASESYGCDTLANLLKLF